MAFHETKSPDQVLKHVRKPLKPGGKLLLIEATQDRLDVQLIFGTSPAWWSSEEPTLNTSPNVYLETWDEVLRGTGFTGVDFEIGDWEQYQYQSSSIILPSANTTPALPSAVSIVYTVLVLEAWNGQPTETIPKRTGISVTIEPREEIQPENKAYSFTGEMAGPFLDGRDQASFRKLQRLLVQNRGNLWLSCAGASDAQTLIYAQTYGLLCTLRHTTGPVSSLVLAPIPMRANCALVTQVPDVSFLDAACIPVAFAMAYLSLIYVARLRQGESYVGAEVFAAFDSELEQGVLVNTSNVPLHRALSLRDSSIATGLKALTKGKGFDVVLDPPSSKTLEPRQDFIGRFGWFVETGGAGAQAGQQLDWAHRGRGLAYAPVGVLELAEYNGRVFREATENVAQYPVSRTGEASRRREQKEHAAGWNWPSGGALDNSQGGSECALVFRNAAKHPHAAGLLEAAERESRNVQIRNCDVSPEEILLGLL
ncbi:hypothetical protein DL766_004775 [Monosporascus sp. MC13-8B]|uniref:Enoyl reductase (ER) domain-containing protein n=1 Tax=Monosporascus cannonballus TaxID=155416 RepID=A0ABY0H5T5_9PEZI|nr:hypothetical protein DL762_005230 [Monosporascus cannonballus]RYO96699.1 hypothetical protein DL763_003075 [Monosporascus cannonballus]RYP30679.1 hypothetical protein DL766_004775 [Monosporascus sp. MC13-8B]